MSNISRRSLLAGAIAVLLAAEPAFARPPTSKPGPRIVPRVSTAARSAVAQLSQANGGHVHKHIGQNNGYMKGRVDAGSSRAFFNAAANNKPVTRLARSLARPKAASTFHTNRVADAMYNQSLRTHRREIAAWMASPSKDSYHARFNANQAIGTVYSRPRTGNGPGTFAPASHGQFVLRKTPGGKTFYPHTATLSRRGTQ